MVTKQEQRNIAIMNRKNISLMDKQIFSKIICQKLKPYLNEKIIMSYMPTKDEVNIDEINNNYKVAYPVIDDKYNMCAYIPNNTFIKNKYGILEPDINNADKVVDNDIQIVIVPLLAFDEDLNRLGHGKGYYDRFLSKCKNALKIGVSFESQKFNKVIVDTNDVKLDLIITEKDIYKN